MSFSFIMPQLGESVTEGTIVRWMKSVGDRVEVDDPLLEVSTDKVDTEILAPVRGTLASISAVVDDVVGVGTEVAVIDVESVEARTGSREADVAPVAEPNTPVTAAGGSMFVSPLVRKLASEHGVDLSTIVPTGPSGRIRKVDVLEAAKATAAASNGGGNRQATDVTVSEPGGDRTADVGVPASTPEAPGPSRDGDRIQPLSRLRTVIARRMVESLAVSAQLTSVIEIDVSRIVALRRRIRAEFQAREGVKLTLTPFFALAAVEALREHNVLNASIDTDAGTVIYHDGVHLGIAVDTPRGLMVPVVANAGDLNLPALARAIGEGAASVRDNTATADMLAGATFTLTNTGSRGMLFDTPIINQPQVAILGTGVVTKRPAVVMDADGEEAFAVRSIVCFALTYDHRLVDGADAARFLSTIKSRLEIGNFRWESRRHIPDRV